MFHNLRLGVLLVLLVGPSINCEVILQLSFNESVYLPVVETNELKVLKDKLKHDSEGIPLKCRRDYCKFDVTKDEYKGMLRWEVTPVGNRRYQRCPYAFEDSWRIAYFECLPVTEKSDWANLNMTLCPDTPLTEALRFVYEQQLSRQESRKTTQDPFYPLETNAPLNSSVLIRSAAHLDKAMKKHSHIAMLSTEWLQVFKIMLKSPITSKKLLSKHDCDVIYSIWDTLVGNVHVMLGSAENETSAFHDFPNIYSTICMRTSYLGLLTYLPISLQYESSSVEALTWSHDPTESRDVRLEMKFSGSPELTSVVVITMPEECGVCDLAVVAFREKDLLHKKISFKPDVNQPPNGEESNKKKEFLQHGPVIFTEIHNENGTDLSTGMVTIKTDIPKVDVPQNADPSFVECGYSDFLRPVMTDPNSLQAKEEFSAANCVTRDDIRTDRVTCICTVPVSSGALITLFFAEDESFVPKIRSNPSDVGVFLRFPYKYDLTVTGYALKGLSTLCLLLTLLSYGLFRKAHRGVLTNILLHLVVAMLCVNIMFFISIVMTDTYMGCRVANALRLYFVLVSLMWNGVEAVNMYLLLIQVFNSTIERFILKAGIIAWGIPIIPVAASLIANKYSFDGEWINCNFVCSLPKLTLYLAFLLPLGVIMLFNLTVFSLVLRVILTKQKTTPAKEMGRNRMVQLSGAVAMLVLLGVPWIFGVFGVIDGDSNDDLALTELTFHIIFILGLNFQGVFIFWFHCLRLKEISNSWKMKFTSLSLLFKTIRSKDYSTSGSSPPTLASSSM